jgi:hypothetical protein
MKTKLFKARPSFRPERPQGAERRNLPTNATPLSSSVMSSLSRHLPTNATPFLAFAFALLIALAGCSGNDNNNGGDALLALEVAPETKYFTCVADTFEVEVYALDAWTAEVNSDATAWCSVSPAFGDGDDYMKIFVKPNTNPLSANRSATVTFTSGDLTATVAVTQEVIQTTVCTQCLWDGETEAWVDGRVTTKNYPFDDATVETDVHWAGVDSWQNWTQQNANSDRDGRANTAKINALPGSAVQICKDLGEGWYLPAYEEMYNLSTASPTWGGLMGKSPLNERAAAGLIVAPVVERRDGDNVIQPASILYWSSTEFGEQEGERLVYSNKEEAETLGNEHSCAVTCTCIGNSPYTYKTNGNILLQCAWRPE